MKIVKKGSLIQVDYEGKLQNGKLFDTSKEEIAKANKIYQPGREYTPLEVKVGETQLIKGFTDGLIGMKEGEEKEVTIEPKDAYGESNPAFIQYFKKEVFRGLEPKKEQLVVMEVNGTQRPARIKEIQQDKIQLDFNHTLAGKTLIFKIKVLKIIK